MFVCVCPKLIIEAIFGPQIEIPAVIDNDIIQDDIILDIEARISER